MNENSIIYQQKSYEVLNFIALNYVIFIISSIEQWWSNVFL